MVVIDPNPQPALVPDVEALRGGLARGPTSRSGALKDVELERLEARARRGCGLRS
jgi:hypothetical protein